MANSNNSISGGLGKLGRSAGMLALAAIVAAALTTFVARSDKPAGKDSFYGMVVGPQVDVDRAIPKLSALGVNTVRLRMSVKDWAHPTANTGAAAYDGALEQAPKLDEKGFRVVLQVDSEGGAMPSYARAKALFSWLMDRPGAKSVDVVEVLGPVTDTASNADAFSTTLTRAQQAKRYVDGPLKAAWEVVHGSKHKKVLGGAFTPFQQAADLRAPGSSNLSVTQAYVNAGYLDRVDYAGFHPDQSTVALQEAWVRRATDLLGRKPVWVSEWQLNRQAFANDGAYLDAMGKTLSNLRAKLGVACYSGFTDQEGVVPVTQGGLGGYREDDPAFTTYREWPKKK
ncbi:MAG TPA: hypothetical protein VLM05_17585 [Mycobacteriales bacterium]|nr:hypothetical protein [Mycobacteriales bacterium]